MLIWSETGVLHGVLSHLPSFAEASAKHLIHGRFREAGADPFPYSVALTIDGNETTIIHNVEAKLHPGFQKFARGSMATRGHVSIQSHLGGLHPLQGLVDVHIPQIPFDTKSASTVFVVTLSGAKGLQPCQR